MVFCVRLDGSRNFCIRFHLKNIHPEVKAASVYQIWNSFGFVILLPILVTNQLGMGDPFLQIPLSTGSIRGGTSTFDCKCRHPCGIGKAVYMEGRNTGCGRVVKPYVLSPVLQMDLSAWRSLCAF